jgi:hypothetical protein
MYLGPFNGVTPPFGGGKLLYTTPTIKILIEKSAIRFSKSNFGSPDHMANIQCSDTSHDHESRYEGDKDFRNSHNHNRYQGSIWYLEHSI